MLSSRFSIPEIQRLPDLRSDPADQVRLFRGRLATSGDSCMLKIDLGELEAVWMLTLRPYCPPRRKRGGR